MKFKLFSLTAIFMITIFSGSLLTGQPGNYLEKIESLRITFFTERLDLTSDEASRFWPVYKDFNNRREKINEDRRILFRYVMKNTDFLTDKEINESLEKYITLQKEEAELTEVFNRKFLEILPAKKVLAVYIAENQFKAYILNQLRESLPDERFQRRIRP